MEPLFSEKSCWTSNNSAFSSVLLVLGQFLSSEYGRMSEVLVAMVVVDVVVIVVVLFENLGSIIEGVRRPENDR
jgi:hypothetical protein